MTSNTTPPEIADFLNDWTDNSNQIKEAFIRLKDFLENIDGVGFSFKGRPGVSYSLRAKHINQKERDLFVMVDVIDDDPSNRWLSVCFYGDLLTDPEEQGDLVPGGLAGDDGYCFDIDEWDEEALAYLEERLNEACTNASE